MTAVLFAKWVIVFFSMVGGIYAINRIVTEFLEERDIRQGRFLTTSRESAKRRLQMEILTILAAAKMGQSSINLDGLDAFVDDFAEALKNEIRHEAKSWE